MGMQEMGLAMETLCAEGCGMAGTWYLVLTAGMAAVGIRENGSEEQKETYLPDIANGERNFSIGITEPEARTNTLNVATRAEKDGDEYVLNGQKAWITFSDRADNMVLVTRTTPREEVDRGTDGISLFIVDMDSPGIDVSPIPKHGINYSKSCEVFFEDVRAPKRTCWARKTAGGGRSSTCSTPSGSGSPRQEPVSGNWPPTRRSSTPMTVRCSTPRSAAIRPSRSRSRGPTRGWRRRR